MFHTPPLFYTLNLQQQNIIYSLFIIVIVHALVSPPVECIYNEGRDFPVFHLQHPHFLQQCLDS